MKRRREGQHELYDEEHELHDEEHDDEGSRGLIHGVASSAVYFKTSATR
jgi:hypothetical protein